MPYTVSENLLNGVLILEPKVFQDSRGYFMESFNLKDFRRLTETQHDFVQDNHSLSKQGVLRGLHYQIRYPQGKLVRVTRGAVFDVVVDLRKSSTTFGQWSSIEISETNRKQVWIPPGFAHGFLVTSDVAELQYKTTEYWQPNYERSLLWNDPTIGIKWPSELEPLLADKDKAGTLLINAEVFE